MFKLSRPLKLRPSFSCFKGQRQQAATIAISPAEQHRSSFSRTLKALLGLSVGVTLSLSSPMALAEQSATNNEQQISVFTCSSRKIFFYHMGLSKDFPYLSA